MSQHYTLTDRILDLLTAILYGICMALRWIHKRTLARWLGELSGDI